MSQLHCNNLFLPCQAVLDKGGVNLSFKSARKAKGMTLKQASEAFEVSIQAVCLWESEKTMPSAALLPKIADVYGVTIDELFRKE